MQTAETEFLTIREVSTRLRLSHTTVTAMLHRGQLRGFQVSQKSWRIVAKSVDDYISNACAIYPMNH